MKTVASELLAVVDGCAEDEDGVTPAVGLLSGVTVLRLVACFVLDDDLVTVVLPNETTVVAVEAEIEVVVMVVPTTVPLAAVTVSVVVVRGAPPGAINMASIVGAETVAGSTHSPVKSPTKPAAQQK